MVTPLAIALVTGLLGLPLEGRKPVVITTDVGTETDDQWAIVHLALSPGLEVRGIVTTHAPNLVAPPAETSADFARQLVAHLPEKLRPPVIAGSNTALDGTRKPHPGPGVDFLIEQAKGRTRANPLVVVVIGAATDVASALLTDPTWADRVALVTMAFDEYPKGGDVWNVKNDVIAWRILLESRAPIVVGDSTLTKKLLRMTPDRVHTLLAMTPEPGPALVNRFDSWTANNAKMLEGVTGSSIVWPIWDEVVTAYLIGLTKTESRPRPRLKDDLSFDLENPQGTIDWVTSIDDGALWTDLVNRLKALHP